MIRGSGSSSSAFFPENPSATASAEGRGGLRWRGMPSDMFGLVVLTVMLMRCRAWSVRGTPLRVSYLVVRW